MTSGRAASGRAASAGITSPLADAELAGITMVCLFVGVRQALVFGRGPASWVV